MLAKRALANREYLLCEVPYEFPQLNNRSWKIKIILFIILEISNIVEINSIIISIIILIIIY